MEAAAGKTVMARMTDAHQFTRTCRLFQNEKNARDGWELMERIYPGRYTGVRQYADGRWGFDFADAA